MKKNDNYDLFSWNSLISLYSKYGVLLDAAKVFDEMPVRDIVSWNSIISGFLKNGDYKMGFGYFREMYELGGCRLDHATLTSILSICNRPSWYSVSEMIHAVAFINGYEKEISVGNALVTSYFKCGRFNSGKKVFVEMLYKNVITWTAVISGLSQNQFYEESLEIFRDMRFGSVEPNTLTYLSSLLACSGLQALNEGRKIHGLVWKLGVQSDLYIESALMDMYSKCRSIHDSLRVFETAEVLDEVSMTVVLVGFAQNGFEEEAIHIFIKMVKQGIEIDANVVSAVLAVFGVDTSLSLGKQIHTLIIKKGFNLNAFVSNGLINMYSKCGDLEDSIKLFEHMHQRNSISWNSMIAAFARHGNGHKALQLYENMKFQGVEPTDVTFLSLIHACSHVGLVEKGMEFYETMGKDYQIAPRMEHYACVVDMLGRTGHIKEAKIFIDKMPIKPDLQIWQALLGACAIHGDTKIGKYAADKLISESPNNSKEAYISLANIYSSRGRWKERAKAIKKMKDLGVEKETGMSWIEIEKKVHSFVVEDQMHPQGEKIYHVLLELLSHMSDEAYLPNKRIINRYYPNQDEIVCI